MTKVQLNIQVRKKLAQQVRADARRNGKTIDSIGEIIFEDFFNGWTPTERAEFYKAAKDKTMGRRIGSAAPVTATA